MQIDESRHPSVRHFAPLFAYEHLPVRLQPVSKIFHDAAQQLVDITAGNDNPEVATSLRKLLEAKDCAVRADGLARGFRPVPLTEEPPAGPVGTEPGCQHSLCVLTHPHAGPALLAAPPTRWASGLPGASGGMLPPGVGQQG